MIYLGYLKDSSSGAYGYVFQRPLDEPDVAGSLCLLEVLELEMLPALNECLMLAIVLIETVLQLHTSGWLHKGIRSDNILFPRNSIVTLSRFSKVTNMQEPIALRN